MTFENEMKGLLPDGFSVVEEVSLGNISDLKKENELLPTTDNVLFEIKSASIKENKDRSWRVIKTQLRLVEGIRREENGNEVVKFKGKVLFKDFPYYGSPEKYKGKFWFDKQQYLIELKELAKAIDTNLADFKVNDKFICDLHGKRFIGKIVSKPKKFKTVTGEEKSDIVNDVVNLRKAEVLL